MTHDLIINVALIAGILLLATIGFIRSVQREIFVTAAVLAGWAVADARATDWARWLSDFINITPATARFIVLMTCVYGSALILGVGGGALSGRIMPTLGTRLAGAALGAVNAALLSAYTLSAYTDAFRRSSWQQAIADARLATAIRDDYGRLLLVCGGAMALMALFALGLTGRKEPPLPAGRTYPKPVPRDAGSHDDDHLKFEPATRPTRRSPAIEHTMPIPPVDAGRFGDSGGRRPPARFGTGRGSAEWTSIDNPDLGATAPIPGVAGADGSAATVSCRSCGASVSATDVYCPICGKLTR